MNNHHQIIIKSYPSSEKKNDNWLVVEPTPLKNDKVRQLRDESFPMEKSSIHVPNHQRNVLGTSNRQPFLLWTMRMRRKQSLSVAFRPMTVVR
jgi:hypothetical protein